MAAAKASTVFSPIYSHGHQRTLLNSLHQSWLDGEFCDITLHVGDRSIKAHKVVLSSLSEYFRILLRMDARDKTDVKLHEIDFVSLELLLKFAYTGSLDVSRDTVQDLFVTADYLQVKFVKEACEKILLNSVDKDSCVAILLLALKHSLRKIRDRCIVLICRHLEDASKLEEFLSIPYKCLLKILTKNDLIVFRAGYPLPDDSNELAILNAAVRYIAGQREEHELTNKQIKSLVVAARLIYMDHCDWEQMLECHKEVITEDRFRSIIRFFAKYKEASKEAIAKAKVIPGKLIALKTDKRTPHLNDTKIITDENKYNGNNYGYPPDFFNDNIFDDYSRITKLVVVLRFLEFYDDNIVAGLHVHNRSWNYHGLKQDAPEAGEIHEIQLGKSEVIVQVDVTLKEASFITEAIHSLTFVTNLGRSLGPYGGVKYSHSQYTRSAKPPPDVSAYLDSFAGKETNDGSIKGIARLTFNWICHRDLDNPACIGGCDWYWDQLGREEDEEEEEEEDRYTSSEDVWPSYLYDEEEEEWEEEDEDNH